MLLGAFGFFAISWSGVSGFRAWDFGILILSFSASITVLQGFYLLGV